MKSALKGKNLLIEVQILSKFLPLNVDKLKKKKIIKIKLLLRENT